MKVLSLLSLILILSSCSSSSKKVSASNWQLLTMNEAPTIGTTMAGQEIKLGGFSGLQFLYEKNGKHYFLTLTDRGPNGEMVEKDRPFLLPDYSPMLVILKADLTAKTLTVEKEIKLKKKNGEPLTGLPPSRQEENPLDIFGLVYSIDELGMDTEAVVTDAEGGYWVAEEYAPSLAYFDSEGKLQKRFTPDHELPRQYKNRRTNRGFEAIAKNGNKLFGFLQSPLEKGQDQSLIVEVDLENSKTSAEYFYPFEKGNDKIGDAVHLKDNKILVLEQNGKTGPEAQKSIHLIELGESDSTVKKTLVVDLAQSPFKDMEKIEGMAIVENKKIALVYDNDFQLAGHTDFKTGITPLDQSKNQILIIDVELSPLF